MLLLTAVWGSTRILRLDRKMPSPRARLAGRLLLALAAVALLIAGSIEMTGGGVIQAGPIRASLRSARNPLTVAWLGMLLAVFCLYPVRLRRTVPTGTRSWVWRGTGIAALTCGLLTAALLAALIRVVLSGEYVAPDILWRSSPPGVDVLTMVLGHPRHAITGEWTWRAYERLSIDPMEQSLWLGLAPLVLLVRWRRWWFSAEAAPWAVIAVVFAVLALGPFMRVGGLDTGLPLPDALIRYVPVLSNARMPGRAVVIVQLAMALLLAVAWSRRQPRPSAGAALAALIIFESLPGGVPVYELPRADDIDRALAASSPGGAVIELPTGIRDGFGERGAFDHRALIHQIAHERPLAGGFVARLSPLVTRAYSESAVLSTLLEASRPPAHARRSDFPSAADAVGLGFSFLIVNRDLLGAESLPREDIVAAGWRFDRADGARELYTARR